MALSFASEQRDYVMAVAVELNRLGLRPFYADERQFELWGKNQVEELQRVYEHDSGAVVMFISGDYEAKEWPTHERRAALARAIREREVYLLPVRFDDTVVPGLDPNMAYLRAEKFTPEELAAAIAEKVRPGRTRGQAPATKAERLLRSPDAALETNLRVEVTPEVYDQNNDGYKAAIRISNLDEPGAFRVAVKALGGLQEAESFAEWDAAWSNAYPSAERKISTGDDSLALLANLTVKRDRISIIGLSCPLELGSMTYTTHPVLVSEGVEPVVFTVRIAHLDAGRVATRSFSFGWEYPPETRPVQDGRPILGAA